MKQDSKGNLKHGIVEIRVKPNNPGLVSEQGRFARVKSLLRPWLKKSEVLVAAYAEAKAVRPSIENVKLVKDAVEIAAKEELIQGKINLVKQEEVQKFNAIVDDIYKNDGLPEEAKLLKLVKLIQANQKVLAQWKKLCATGKKLRLTRATIISLIEDE
ncbi:MAG: hypothetical protein GWN67_01370 [Phycisphaerae bacterium]|nr:hypothetical protein [Phycisphaerae bacterium]NIP50608.1 hypothetical protein [Phycisphaerae bacterium]NIS49744.1 hypothetical protein [Phycisphaerae bacterium]NIU07496.1 hypothetical protein [Phycisphaerae bacterium]NIU55086.1 hypothetical protein [Phycisphaerae bacterium]